MLRPNTIIFLGDLVRALELLQPTDDFTRRAISELLGLQWEKQPDHDIEASIQSPEPAPLQPSSLPLTPIPTSPTQDYIADPVPSSLERLPDETESWSIGIEALPEQTISEEVANPPLLEPLFVPVWARGILYAALSTRSDEGPLDVEKIVDCLARNEYIDRLPMLPWLTLRHGVQVLVDRSHAMIPFARDQIWLEREILRVVGTERVETLRFIGNPLRGAGTGPKKTWPTYRPPLPGTMVLLLTDLGIGQPMFSIEPASVQEWLDFAFTVQQAGCSLVAFVPYRPSRWPTDLVDRITVIQWDRKTTAATVRNLIERTNKGVD